MALVSSAHLPPLIADIRAGRRRLIGWGVLDAALAHHWRCPLPVHGWVDTDPAQWGRDVLGAPVHSPDHLASLEPGTFAVLVHRWLGADYPRITGALETRYGSPPWFLPLNTLDEAMGAAPDWRAGLAALRHGLPRPRDSRPAVAVVLERLDVGGAERQACLLAEEFRRLDWPVSLFLQKPSPPEAAPALRRLRRAGVAVRHAPAALPPEGVDWDRWLEERFGPGTASCARALPAFLLPAVFGLAAGLGELRPDLVISHLDRPNLIGGMAAVLARIPEIVLSVRNLDPTHFPQFFAGQTEAFRRLYRLLAGLPGLHLTANAQAAAASYAHWLELPAATLPVVVNAAAPEVWTRARRLDPAEARRRLGLPPGGPVVAGLFRLSPEKQPLMFITVVERLRRSIPELTAILCGSGPLESAVAAEIARRGLGAAILLRPASPEVGTVLRACDLLLHTAAVEGMPNVVLEAQSCGVPVVATLAGGTLEALAPVLRPHARPVDDAEGLAVAARTVLALSPAERSGLADTLRSHVRRHHHPARLVEAYLDITGVPVWRALARAAEDCGNNGRFAPAIRLARRAAAAAPDQPAASIVLAELLRKRGHGGAAATVLRGALRRAGERAELWNHLGLALRDDCREDESLAAFRHGARLDPEGPWSRTNMGFGLMRQPGDRAAATFAALGRAGEAPEAGLGLFCDRFPHTYGFLIQQFVTYLRHFPDAAAYSFGRRVLEPYGPEQFDVAMAGFGANYPDLAGRVTQLVPVLDDFAGDPCLRIETRGGRFHRPRLAHNIFAMNADLFRPFYETLGIPFSFTLNPGGAFRLGHPHSDDRLRRVFDSALFRKVIVTYPLTRDYVLDRFQLPDERIALIPGTIVVERLLDAHRGPKRRFGIHKDTLDLCFVGMRYSPTGADKGYDRFIAAMALLAPRLPALRIHVVGNFDVDTVACGGLAGRIAFHGPRDQRWLAAFYGGIDAIVSPNVADQLAKGAFDGFPVTSCIEAGMCGVALFATDPMGLNMWLRDGIDYVAIDRDPRRIADRLESWLATPERLYRLAESGERRFHAHWGEEAQMGPRVALMTELLSREG